MGLRNIIKKVYYSAVKIKKLSRNFMFPTARILLYHRVASVKTDFHLLCVSPENFRNQIKYLKENFKIIPLVKLAQDVGNRKIQKDNIVITFDDGYADNLHNALPILEEFGVPATTFLTVGYMDLPSEVSTKEGQNKPFYWDKNGSPEDRGRPLTLDEAKQLSSSRLIEIGGHTLNHPKLAKIPEDKQFKEVVVGKQVLEKMLNVPLVSFAYPFGGQDSFNKKTVELVKKAGFHYACANIHERVTSKSDIYVLPRFIIRNWDINEFKHKIKEFI